MVKMTDHDDMLTLGRATQLLTSKDLTVRSIFSEQMRNTIRMGLGAEPSYVLPSDTISAFLSGSSEEGICWVRFSQQSFANLWTLARAAARRLVARVDVSGDVITRLVADDISVLPVKAIRGLRTVVRQRHSIPGSFSRLAIKAKLQMGWLSIYPLRMLREPCPAGRNLGTRIGNSSTVHGFISSRCVDTLGMRMATEVVADAARGRRTHSTCSTIIVKGWHSRLVVTTPS